jgi:hypothetical protein
MFTGVNVIRANRMSGFFQIEQHESSYRRNDLAGFRDAATTMGEYYGSFSRAFLDEPLHTAQDDHPGRRWEVFGRAEARRKKARLC